MSDCKRKNKNKVGRPRKNKTPEEMIAKINEYFEETEFPTICGLALAVGYAEHHSLDDCIARNDEFSPIVREAKLIVEEKYEEGLRGKSIAGCIFALCNMGWKNSHDFTTGGKPIDSPAPVIQVILSKDKENAEGQ